DARSRRGLGKETRLGHSGNRVDLQNKRLAGSRQYHVDARIHPKAEGAKRIQCQLLNLFRLSRLDAGRANMLRGAASLWIEKGILICEIVETALWDYLENRQGLVTENADRQFPARHKFFYQQFMVILRRIGNRWLEFLRFFYDINTDGGALSRRLDYNGQLHARTLMRSDGFPLRSPHTVLVKFLLRSDFIESQLTPLDSFARVSNH